MATNSDSPISDRVSVASSELSILAKLIRLCRVKLGHPCSSVKVGKDFPETFGTMQGFRQCEPLNIFYMTVFYFRPLPRCSPMY